VSLFVQKWLLALSSGKLVANQGLSDILSVLCNSLEVRDLYIAVQGKSFERCRSLPSGGFGELCPVFLLVSHLSETVLLCGLVASNLLPQDA